MACDKRGASGSLSLTRSAGSSNARLANGVAPLRALAAAGVQVAIGMDDMAIADRCAGQLQIDAAFGVFV